MGAAEAKRIKREPGSPDQPGTDLVELLQRLQTLLKDGQGDGQALDALLDELGRLQVTLNGASEPAFAAIAQAQERLQEAIVALQAAVDQLTPPPGYRPPVAGDEAQVRGLLSYAHRLSYSSSAPLGYQLGQPLYFFKPPAPQEAEMRASQLHAFAREWEERQAALAAQQRAAAQGAAVPTEPQPPAAAPPAAAQPAAPAGDLGALAAQHGLDVQQLLASMPAGWKPGDPISLGPPAAAAAPAAAPAAPALAAAAAPAAAPAPAPEEEEEVARVAPAAPRLAGLFLNPLDLQQYDYVSDEGGAGDTSDDSDDSDEE